MSGIAKSIAHLSLRSAASLQSSHRIQPGAARGAPTRPPAFVFLRRLCYAAAMGEPVARGGAIVDGRDLVVITCGLATTALAFVGVWLADRAGGHVMGHYIFAWGVIPVPVSAFAVGIVAALGYGGASYLTQRKVSGPLLLAVIAFLLGSYLLAQYIEYRVITAGLGDDAIGFWTFFDHATRSFVRQDSSDPSGHGEPLGDLGYALRVLEVVGFVGGGLVVPGALRNKPYCDRCRCYQQSKLVAIVPIGEDEAEAHRRLQTILLAARGGVFDEVAQAIAAHGPLSQRHQIESSMHWLTADLLSCPNCADGALIAMTHQRHPGAPRQVSHVATEIVPLDSELVRDFVAAQRRSSHPYR
jgi:hypothetical protein